jgi:hypothetical protein
MNEETVKILSDGINQWFWGPFNWANGFLPEGWEIALLIALFVFSFLSGMLFYLGVEIRKAL